MLKSLITRLQQGHRTAAFPAEAPVLPDRFRGRPTLDVSRCPDGCRACIEACPTDALHNEAGTLALDMGRCLFCAECAAACPKGAVGYSTEYRLAARSRAELVLRSPAPAPAPPRALVLSQELRR